MVFDLSAYVNNWLQHDYAGIGFALLLRSIIFHVRVKLFVARLLWCAMEHHFGLEHVGSCESRRPKLKDCRT